MNPIKRLISTADRFTTGLVVSILCAVFVPCYGVGDVIFSHISNVAIMLLFFLYGAKLSRGAVMDGLLHWRLQGIVALSTFVLFPLAGLMLQPVLAPMLTPELSMGLLYVCFLPSTVQSSIAFTSIAKGNVAAAVCAASVSSLLGVFMTPLLVGMLLTTTGGLGGLSWGIFADICLIILVPFVLGQLVQRWVGSWVREHHLLTSWTDQSTIWLVVYAAFSHAIVQGVWRSIPLCSLGWVLVSCAIILAFALVWTAWLSRVLGFNREDRIAIIFCGSKKSLATGIPMMNVIFAGSPIGILVIPLMVFHQMQLMVCAFLAKRWSSRQVL
ncbi:MAG: bile acid:sodium symporter family protein [Akkermansia sp.]